MSPVAALSLGTKAETLERLAPLVRHSRVLPLVAFDGAQWRRDPDSVQAQIAALSPRVVVRSSARIEDSSSGSHAGVFDSVLDVDAGDPAHVTEAIDRVLASYRRQGLVDDDEQVLVQPMLREAKLAGVAFTRDRDTGAAYLDINFDSAGRTDAVTGGKAAGLRQYVRHRCATESPPPALAPIVHALEELTALVNDAALDVELAVDDEGVVLFQVRPLLAPQAPVDDALLTDWLDKAQRKLEKLTRPHPHIKGTRSVFGVMTDWNPAEMIGIKPRPLALSTYRELITDRTWASMRSAYGYRDLSSFPLLVSILGAPYIDVRASMNSFVPAALRGEVADRLVNHCLDRLVAQPELHDKIEFDIVFSCYYPGIDKDAQRLYDDGFTGEQVGELMSALRALTSRLLRRDTNVIGSELHRLSVLQERHSAIMSSEMSLVEKIYWLIEDGRRYGTLPFCGLARAGFVAAQFLRGFVKEDLLSVEEEQAFMGSLHTVARELGEGAAAVHDGTLSREAFLESFGHLRPGTYDITTPRYDEAFDQYFPTAPPAPAASEPFHLSAASHRGITAFLAQQELGVTVEELFQFIRAAIEGRERAKLLFTRNISDAYVLLERLGERVGVTRDELSWLNLTRVLELHATLDALDLYEILRAEIDRNTRAHAMTRVVRLPELIVDGTDVTHFFVHESRPNYVGNRRVVADVVSADDLQSAELRDRVVCLPSADPGFDWIFTRAIAGLVTTFGGANSHMAIRAAELGIPAVIGCGHANAARWFAARRLDVDCENRLVRVVS